MKNLFFLLFLFSINLQSKAQSPKDSCVEKDLVDLFSKKRILDTVQVKDNFSLILLPVIGSSPATDVFFGVGGAAGFYVGKGTQTNVSQCNAGIQYTTKNQFLLLFKCNTYTNNNNWFLQTDVRFLKYSQMTFGLSTKIYDSLSLNEEQIIWQEGINETHIGNPMNFNSLKIHQIISKKIIEDVYLGSGFHLDGYTHIEDLLLENKVQKNTFHQQYSIEHHFNTEKYSTVGFSANAVIDKRDQMISPYKGYYFHINYRVNNTLLGSAENSNMLWLEARYYLPLSKRKARHVLAFWAWSNNVINGEVPYLCLPAIGYDQKGFSGRGYVQGRFRGTQMLYSEVEWRFPISKCSGILGGVVFANATTASSKDEHITLFQYIQPSMGIGLRILVDKKMRNNITVDMARGRNSTGFYVSAGEVF